jgi:hypothetical protein
MKSFWKSRKPTASGAGSSSGQGRWQWEQSTGSWVNFTDAATEQIETAYQSGQIHIDLAVDGEATALDLRQMLRTSGAAALKAALRIRRVEREAILHSFDDMSPTEWTWQYDDGEGSEHWVDYIEDYSRQLERQFQQNPRGVVELRINEQMYRIAMEDLTQENTRTYYKRNIRRIQQAPMALPMQPRSPLPAAKSPSRPSSAAPSSSSSSSFPAANHSPSTFSTSSSEQVPAKSKNIVQQKLNELPLGDFIFSADGSINAEQLSKMTTSQIAEYIQCNASYLAQHIYDQVCV